MSHLQMLKSMWWCMTKRKLWLVAYAYAALSLPFCSAFGVLYKRPATHESSSHTRFVFGRECFKLASKQNSDEDNDIDNRLVEESDTELLSIVSREQLVQLCQDYQISASPDETKQILLLRLRQHALREATRAQERIAQRRNKVLESDDNSKERYELVEINNIDNELDEDEEGFFFYTAPDTRQNNQTVSLTTTATTSHKKQAKTVPPLTSSTVTAPPLPPGVQPNQDGERVVTVYSTTDQNDLTGVAAAQPGNMNLDVTSAASAAAASSATTIQPWDLQQQPASTTSTSQRELDLAQQIMVELVSNLLALSGAPAFCMNFDPDGDFDVDDSDSPISIPYLGSSDTSVETVEVGFNPARVPTEWLTKSSSSLLAGRGQVLRDVLRQFEIQAIGQDGMSGDVHYRAVQQVRAFLEGYRRAIVRRQARSTLTILLDKLCEEGVSGLDTHLSNMARSSDDSDAGEGGELNNSLLEFLNDAIRQQEKKAEERITARIDSPSGSGELDLLNRDTESSLDATEALWDVSMEEGQRIETLDPNNPKVRRVLQEEISKGSVAALTIRPNIPESASEKLLLLLQLLRDRIKAEAAFGSDEKGRNLRLLAYCMQVESVQEREQLILSAVGNSLDRLDSFAELTQSSIEYGESTSYELQPAKKQLLNLSQLQQILKVTTDLRRRQTFKASGLKP